MAKLSDSLVKEFARLTNDTTKKKSESFVYGTVVGVNEDESVDVLFDGAIESTPCAASVSTTIGDRVLVMLKNRQGIITANITNPMINTESLEAGSITARREYLIYEVYDGIPCNPVTVISMGREPAWDDEDDMTMVTFGTPGQGMQFAGDTYFKQGIGVENGASFNADLDGSNAGKYVYIGEDTIALTELQVGVQSPSYKGIPGIDALFYGTLRNASDRTKKHYISDTDENDALGKVNRIRHRKFVWNQDDKVDTLGYIAQELKEIDPYLVDGPEGEMAINNTHLIALATKAIQELSAKVDDLEKKLETY